MEGGRNPGTQISSLKGGHSASNPAPDLCFSHVDQPNVGIDISYSVGRTSEFADTFTPVFSRTEEACVAEKAKSLPIQFDRDVLGVQRLNSVVSLTDATSREVSGPEDIDILAVVDVEDLDHDAHESRLIAGQAIEQGLGVELRRDVEEQVVAAWDPGVQRDSRDLGDQVVVRDSKYKGETT
jgi:hypothetical protein